MTAQLDARPYARPSGAPAPAAVDSRRGDVEGLRAVAVVVVVLFHAGVPGLYGGYVGVDVFFVLSGFLITGLLLAEVRRTGTVSLRGFWARRARRLLPLATLVSLVTLAASWLLLTPLEVRQVARDAVWSGLFAMNLLLARDGVDYLADDAESPYQHYWSLGVEEQFYVVWPVAVVLLVLVGGLLARRRGRPAPRGRGTGDLPVLLVPLTVVAVLASFAWGVWQTAQSQPLAYFEPWSRGWELGVGALLAIAAPALAGLPGRVREAAAVVGLAAVLLAALVLDEGTPFPGTAALLPVLGTAAVVAAGTGGTTRLGALLGTAPMRTLGRLSYGWYLWHWPVLVLGPRALGGDPGLAGRLLLSLVALGLAWTTYALLEDPVRRHALLVRDPARSLAVGALCVALAAGTGTVSAALVPEVRGTAAPVAPVATAEAEQVQVGALDEAGVREAVAQAEQLQGLPANLDPVLEDAQDDAARARSEDRISCMVAVEHEDVSREPGGSCVFGSHPDGATTVVLTGDSHAYQWYPAMSQVAERRGWRLVVMTKAGCPLYDVSIDLASLRRAYTECDTWRAAAMERIAQEDPDLVVMSAAVFSPRGDEFTRRWAEGVTTTTTTLRGTGAQVVLLEDTPNPDADVPTCLAENLDAVQECAVDREDALLDPERRRATAQAALAAGAVVVDPVPWFCRDTCPPVIGNASAYHDDDHVSATYAAQLAPLLDARLGAALTGPASDAG
ncbi:acyltransferase family protein [Aquipuribacter hungaricus]|uniref:Acyltransferase family protein n=1 Tax=Aquipuribacter hungaricus TaxID=545624 RepID=A0ABV7WE96_9MICO